MLLTQINLFIVFMNQKNIKPEKNIRLVQVKRRENHREMSDLGEEFCDVRAVFRGHGMFLYLAPFLRLPSRSLDKGKYRLKHKSKISH